MNNFFEQITPGPDHQENKRKRDQPDRISTVGERRQQGDPDERISAEISQIRQIRKSIRINHGQSDAVEHPLRHILSEAQDAAERLAHLRPSLLGDVLPSFRLWQELAAARREELIAQKDAQTALREFREAQQWQRSLESAV